MCVCVCVCVCVKCTVVFPRLLCHGILQARTLEWITYLYPYMYIQNIEECDDSKPVQGINEDKTSYCNFRKKLSFDY